MTFCLRRPPTCADFPPAPTSHLRRPPTEPPCVARASTRCIRKPRTFAGRAVLDAGQLRLLLPEYRVTRLLLAVLLEALPQALLLAAVYYDARSGLNVLDPYIGSVDPSALDLQLLLCALLLSALHVLVGLVDLACRAGRMRVGCLAHACSHLRMGIGLPLELIRRDELDEWTCAPMQLNDAALVRQLGAALQVNRSLRKLVLIDAGLDEERFKQLLDSMGAAAVPALQELRLGGNQIGNLGVEALGVAAAQGALRRLRTLSLRTNGIANGGARELARAAEKGAFPALEVCDLCDNRIGNTGIDAFTHACAGGALPSINYIGLDDNLDSGSTTTALQAALTERQDRLSLRISASLRTSASC